MFPFLCDTEIFLGKLLTHMSESFSKLEHVIKKNEREGFISV